MSIGTQIRHHSGSRSATAPDTSKFSLLPPYLFPTSIVLFLVFGIGPNLMLALLALVCLLVGSALLWRPGEAPTLLLVFLLQWLQAATGVFHANAVGLPITEFIPRYTQSADTATALSLIAIVVLAAGIRLVIGPRDARLGASIRDMVMSQPAKTWLTMFAVVWGVTTGAQLAAHVVPGLSQILLATANFKWAAFVVLTISTFAATDRARGLWAIVFLLELAMSFGGFFASFKDVFYFTLIGIAAAGVRLSPRMVAGGALLSTVLFAFGVVWTAVKSDYRDFASGGSGQQIIVVSREAGISKLYQLLEDLDTDQLGAATSSIFKRLAYVEFFGAAIDHVPRMINHEYGSIWWEAVSRPFMPRFFFPEKSALDDSEMTRKYTGASVSGLAEGTSISIGFIGESYIDFGEFGMMLPIFALGLFMGWLYRWLVRHRGIGPLFGTGLAAATLMTASRIETTAAKTFGALAVSLIVCWILATFVLPRFYRHLQR
jgi:hypothetical protein